MVISKWATICGGCTIFLFSMVSAASGATYYVSSHGNDAASGLSRQSAWRTLERVNRQAFAPGDKILLQGGQVFQGPLKFDDRDLGRAAEPIVVGSFDQKTKGRAIIHAGRGRGIDVFNTSGLRLTDLAIVGLDSERNERSGIFLLSSREQGASHIWIDNVEISGFGKYGISIGTWQSRVGYNNVRITRTSLHDNLLAGVFSWGPWGRGIYAHRDIYIGDSYAYNMTGGSGLILSSVDGGIIERCVVHDNGANVSGAAGIWAWDSNNIIFQYNESYANRTCGVDGDGFDFDGGVTNSVMQYNYSHDNDAAGFLLAQYAHAPQPMKNIVIRYNISENDCRKNMYGAIHLWKGCDGDEISDVQIYQNTVYLTGRAARQAAGATDGRPAIDPLGLATDAGYRPAAIAVISSTRAVSVQNNLFYATRGGALVSVAAGQETLLFRNNAYWSAGDPFEVEWQGVNYTSLADWLHAARDQERLGSRILALHVDPMLEAPGTGGTLGEARLLDTLSAYKLKPGSPLLGRGIDLFKAEGIDPGPRGFFGTPISQAAPPAIGAHLAESPL